MRIFQGAQDMALKLHRRSGGNLRTGCWRADKLAGVGLSRTFQIARGLAQLTVVENLMLYGKHQPGETFCAAVLRTRASRAREEELRQRAISVARELNLLQVGDNRAIDL